MDLRSLIRDVPDFPKQGILFRDITPLLQDPEGLKAAVHQLAQCVASERIDYVVGIESRGFIFGVPLAFHLEVGFIPVRKPNKLPPPVYSESYSLEYGTDSLEIREHIFKPGERVLIVDDLIATGGTAAATINLVQKAGAEVVGIGFLIELTFLKGRNHLPPGIPVHTLIAYD